ncbi:MAG: PQQ-binding-like beta-propeller repeat protein [Candidatus Acidiferrales bacterium]
MRANPILYTLYALSAAYVFTMGSFSQYQPTNDQFPVEEWLPVRTVESIPGAYPGAIQFVSSDGVIFTRSSNELASFSAESGKMLFNFGNSSFYAPTKSGDAVIGSPPTDAQQEIEEVRANGDVVWRLPVPGHPQALTPSPEGTLYASIAYGLYAISPSHTIVWHHDDIERPATSTAVPYALMPPSTGLDGTFYGGLKVPAVAPDGTVYVSADAGMVFAFSVSGEKLWSTSVQQNGLPVLSDPVLGADGGIYIISGRDLVRIGPQGKVLWRYTAPVTPYWNWLTRPTVTKSGAVYLVRRSLFCIAEDGKEKWRFHPDTPGEDFISPVTVGPDGTVYLFSQGTGGGRTYALTPDGRKKWSLLLGTYSGVSPLLDDRGQVWLTTNNGFTAISVAHQ